jgi:hypothetical protein
LRRYNEAALTKEIQELLTNTWAAEVAACARIFIRAPSANRQIFFSGKKPVFAKDDR